MSDDFNFNEIIEKIPKNFTGADFYGLTSQSVLIAIKRKIKEINLEFGYLFSI